MTKGYWMDRPLEQLTREELKEQESKERAEQADFLFDALLIMAALLDCMDTLAKRRGQ